MITPDDSANALAKIATSAQSGDRQSVVAEVVNQGTNLLSGLPGVGALAKSVFEPIARRTSYGRMQAAVVELEADASETERARKVGSVIAAMVREVLYEADGSHVQAALAGLEQRVSELNASIDRLAAQSGGPTHHNNVGEVSEGSVGIAYGNVTIENFGRK